MQHRRPSISNWETLEGRQLMAGDIDFLGTSGPVANVGDDPRGVTAVDVNGDGKVDLLTSNAQGLSVAIGDGAGGFTLTADVNIGKQVLDLRTADLNGDGKTDVVTSDIFGDVNTFQGNGDGTFGAATPLTFGDDDTPRRPVTLVDMNGDGRPDFVSGIVSASDGVLIRYNASAAGGAIAFDDPTSLADAIDGDVAAADVNADAKPDLIGIGNDGVVVLLNTGNDISTGRATFADPVTYATTFINPNALFVTDVTGDAKADVIANYLSQDFDVLTNNGDGTFGAASKQEQIVFNDGFADVNGDGKIDAYGTSPSFGKKLAIALGNGNGTFQEAVTLTLGDVSFSGSAVADVNSDGKADVLIVDNDQDRVVVLPGGDAPTPPPGGNDPGGNDGNDPGGNDPGGNDPPADPTPTVDLTPAAPTGLAAQLVAGQKVKTSVNVVNSGEESSAGPVTVKIYASADGVIDAGDTVLTEITKTLKIAAKKSKAVKLNFVVPSVGDGTFQVLTQVSGGGDAAAANNAAAGASVNFVVPKLDVSAGLAPVASLKAGKKAKAQVDILNAGGADLKKAPATVTLFATTDGTLNGQEVQLAQVNTPLSLKAGKVKKAKLSFLVPAELAGQTRTLVARVQLAGDVQAGNDVATGQATSVQ